MNITLLAFLQAVLSLFAIVDPVGGIPIFLVLTEGLSDPERRRILRFAVLTAFILIVAFALAGSAVMKYVFQINLSEFTFAGGLLLVVVGIREMVHTSRGERPAAQQVDDPRKHSHYQALAVSPIAVPLLAGPGTIVTVILFQGQYGQLFAIAACVVVFALALVILHYSARISRLIGQVGMLAVTRIMQIFIIAIGVRFMFMGLREAFPKMFGG